MEPFKKFTTYNETPSTASDSTNPPGSTEGEKSTLEKFFQGSNKETIESLKAKISDKDELIKELVEIAERYAKKIFPGQNEYVDDLIKRARNCK